MPRLAIVTAMSAWSPLRLPLFRALWLGSVVSNIGTTMNDTAAVWTMTTLTASPTMVSLMQTMGSLPLFLLALPAGAMADLVDRRRLILAAQTGALLTAAGMAALAWFGQLNCRSAFARGRRVRNFAGLAAQLLRSTRSGISLRAQRDQFLDWQ